MRKLDPDWIDKENMTEEEVTAALDKKYPRMEEPDEEGIDLHPHDPRRRFIAVAAGAIFTKADPLTEEEKAEADEMWEAMTGGNYSPEKKKTKNEEPKPAHT